MTAMILSAIILMWIGGFFLGVSALLGYQLWRMMRNDGWDDSNITNALRLLSHVVLHPEDFGKLQYPSGKRPFWYVDKDEISQVVDSRPE